MPFPYSSVAVCLLIGMPFAYSSVAVCLLISSCLCILFIYIVSDWCSRVWVLSFLCSLNLLVLPTDLFVLALLLLAVCIVLACSLHCLYLYDMLLLLAKWFAYVYKMCCLCKQDALFMWAKRFAYVSKMVSLYCQKTIFYTCEMKVSLLTIWKHCDCWAITMLLGGKSYAIMWWKHSYCPAVSVLAFCQKIVILDVEKVSICKWWWSISWLLVLFSFLLFLQCILARCHSVLFLE